MPKIIHLCKDLSATACNISLGFASEMPTAVGAPSWDAVTCPQCQETALYRELSGESNPRGAGRKPTGIIKTTLQVTVYPSDLEAFSTQENRSKFIRDAISEKLSQEQAPNTWSTQLPGWCQDLAGVILARPEFQGKGFRALLEAALWGMATDWERGQVDKHQ